MQCFVTPKLGVRTPLTLIPGQPPVCDLDIDGGYGDATIPCKVPVELRGMLKRAYVELYGPTGPIYLGRVVSATRTGIRCAGLQNDLSESRAGVVYRSYGPARWKVVNGEADVKESNANGFEITFPKGWKNDSLPDAKRETYIVIDFPELVTNPKIVFPYACNSSAQMATWFAVNYIQNFGAWQYDSMMSAQNLTVGAGTCSLTVAASNVTALVLAVGATQYIETETTIDHVVLLNGITVYGTSVVDASIVNVANHICAQAGIADYECTVPGNVVDWATDTKSSTLNKFEELVRYVDSRAYFTARNIGGLWKPKWIHEPLTTEPRYTLVHDGKRVNADFAEESAADMYRVVHAHYGDTLGRPRYAAATDSDQSHFLVMTGEYPVYDVDVDTTSSTTAQQVADTLAPKVGLEKAEGTLTLIGSPDGILACTYEVGELYEVTDKYGKKRTCRATHIQRTGDRKAVVTMDNSVSEDVLLARVAAIDGSSGTRII